MHWPVPELFIPVNPCRARQGYVYLCQGSLLLTATHGNNPYILSPNNGAVVASGKLCQINFQAFI